MFRLGHRLRIGRLAPVAVSLTVVGALLGTAGPVQAAADDILPTLTSFSLSTTAVDVTYADAHLTVLMSVSDPDATGVGTGDVIAHGPMRGYHPSGHLVQVGGTATNTQYRADITLPAGKAVEAHMSILFTEADQFFLVDLDSQLAASGFPSHVTASVTAPPAPPGHLTFRRDLTSGVPIIIVGWDRVAAGTPVPTGATATGSGCGTLQSANAGGVRFNNVPSSRVRCTVTVSLLNSAGSSAAVTATARV
jgi:hypothetical protein